MKITYVINSIKKSGPNKVLLNMVSGLRDDDIDIEVVSFFDSGDADEVERLKALGASVVVLNVPKSKIITSGARALKRHLSGKNVDVVHSHGILSDIAVVRAGFGKVAVTTIHNDMFDDYALTFGRIKGFAYVLIHILHLQFFKQVVCCSRSAHSKLRRYVKRASYIVNGISYDSSEPGARSVDIREEFGIPVDGRVFLYTGKLNSRKNVIGLLKKFLKTRNDGDFLIIVGDGELARECERYVGEGIFLVGFKSDVKPYYRAADVYVSASRAEGFSISVVEALAENLLLLLSDIPSHKEVFAINSDMYIGEIFTTKGFAEAKVSLDTIRGQSRLYYDAYLTDSMMMDSYKKLYDGVVA